MASLVASPLLKSLQREKITKALINNKIELFVLFCFNG